MERLYIDPSTRLDNKNRRADFLNSTAKKIVALQLISSAYLLSTIGSFDDPNMLIPFAPLISISATMAARFVLMELFTNTDGENRVISSTEQILNYFADCVPLPIDKDETKDRAKSWLKSIGRHYRKRCEGMSFEKRITAIARDIDNRLSKHGFVDRASLALEKLGDYIEQY